MPKAFLSYRGPRIRRRRRSALAEWAIEKLDIKPGDAVLIYRCGHGWEFDTLQAAVGDNGRIVGLDDSRQIEWAQNVIALQGWKNIEALEPNLASLEQESFDAVVAGRRLLKEGANLAEVVSGFYEILKPGGGAFLLAPMAQLRLRRLRPDGFLQLIEEHFDYIKYAQSRTVLAIAAFKRDGNERLTVNRRAYPTEEALPTTESGPAGSP
jgi:ubiquinone/menaquinone biosynthesis C-methylase UbiE